jgi:hypothetical protein
MIDHSTVTISKLIYHRISSESYKCLVTDQLFSYEGEEEEQVLKQIFLKPFTTGLISHEFKHDINLELNPLFKLAKDIYEGNEDFVTGTQQIYKHLQLVSRHPNIKDGDVFIARFDNVIMHNKMYDALGIYKIENKETFIETDSEGRVGFKKGIGGKKMDKACLILFSEEPYTIFVIDNASADTEYWNNDFINSKPKDDHVNNTSDYLNFTKSFVTDQYPAEYEVTKKDQVELLNRSVEYFKTHDQFNKQEFENDVLRHPELIESYRNYNEQYTRSYATELSDEFEISKEMVKKQARIFKSVLKLDKNFHVYIHGNTELIEKGYDEHVGKHFYKIYFDEEN